MRRRVLQATISAVFVAVALLGVPLGFFGAQLVEQNQQEALNTRAQSIARAVDFRIEEQIGLTDRVLEPYIGGEESSPALIEVDTADGLYLSSGAPAAGRSVDITYVSSAQTTVHLQVSWWDLFWDRAQVIGLVVAASVVAVAAGGALAIWQSDRLSAPMVYLAASAEQLGSGQVRPHLEPSGVEEIDLVISELARSADRMAGRLAAERQFAADASHQLRTPLTALSMRLEEIMLDSTNDRVREEARISLEQVERLVDVVDHLLIGSRRAAGGTTEAVNLAEVVQQQLEEWTVPFNEADRRLVIEVDPDTEVLATPGALAQVLATLVENSLKHGDGTTTISGRLDGTARSVVIEVRDEGEGIPDDLAPRIFERNVTSGQGTGLGLALARDLLSADGGRLELVCRHPAVFAVFLSKVPAGMRTEVVLPKGLSTRPEHRRR